METSWIRSNWMNKAEKCLKSSEYSRNHRILFCFNTPNMRAHFHYISICDKTYDSRCRVQRVRIHVRLLRLVYRNEPKTARQFHLYGMIYTNEVDLVQGYTDAANFTHQAMKCWCTQTADWRLSEWKTWNKWNIFRTFTVSVWKKYQHKCRISKAPIRVYVCCNPVTALLSTTVFLCEQWENFKSLHFLLRTHDIQH